MECIMSKVEIPSISGCVDFPGADNQAFVVDSIIVQNSMSGNSSPDDPNYLSLKELEYKMPRSRQPSIAVDDEEAKWLAWASKQFSDIAGEDRQIDLDEFKQALGVKESFFAERFFAQFDADGSGYISLDELLDGLHLLTKGDPIDKLRFLFKVYDVDGNGSVDRDELKTVLKSCMEESALKLNETQLEELSSALFEAADTDHSGAISFDELKEELEKNPDVLENLTISAASWLKPPTITKRKATLPRYLTLRYVQNNAKKLVFLLCYLAINIGLYAGAVHKYASQNYNTYLVTARGFGQCLNFNSAFILVLMLRKSITYVRATKLASYLPTDQSIIFHKLVGYVIGVFSLGHTLAHIGNAIYETQPDRGLENYTATDILFKFNPEVTPLGLNVVAGSAFYTGWLLDIVLIVVTVCSLPYVRRSGHFQVFYMTHLLYILFWGLLILHGPRFWYWFIVPGVIFLVEKLSQTKLIKLARYGKTYVEDVELLPSGVTHLMVTRPPKFRYKPGDYVFIQIPAIATYEWHPFTISSAPEESGVLSMHIRSVGHWSSRLYQYFEGKQEEYRLSNEQPAPNDHNVMIELESIEEDSGTDEWLEEKSSISDDKSSFSEGTPINHANHRLLKPVMEESETEDELKGPFHCKESQTLWDEHFQRKSPYLRKQKIEVFIDGPYGTPTRSIFQAEHAVLIGAGIGVTPFASILKSTMSRYKASKRTCPSCQHSWLDSIPQDLMRLKKVDFIWINRHQKAFEWFVSLLTQLEYEQSLAPFDRFLELHMYMTAALGRTDMKGIGLQMALDIRHRKGEKDLITGLKTRTHPGRPEWRKIFKKISEEKNGKVTVFFCGSPVLGKVIKQHCETYKFKFHKENF